jgi:hypothetical protein
MPLKQCSKDGKSGWKYGDSGKCYIGPGAKKKAIKQGLAEQYNGGHKFVGAVNDLLSTPECSLAEIQEVIDELPVLDQVLAQAALKDLNLS